MKNNIQIDLNFWKTIIKKGEVYSNCSLGDGNLRNLFIQQLFVAPVLMGGVKGDAEM